MKAKAKKSAKGSWIVRIRSTVIEEIVCEGCTAAEAEAEPWSHYDGVEAMTIERPDYEVLSVSANE